MTCDTLILGIGNVLWADEGFGTRVVEALHDRYAFPDDVQLVDGGTQGMFLLPWVRSARRLLLFDAVDFGDPPATVRLVRGDDVPRFMGAKKVSMHQAGFQEVLFAAELAGDLPEAIALIGVQPERLDDYGGSLSESVKAQIEPAVSMAAAVLDHWGIDMRKRTQPPATLVGTGALDMADYEQGRPYPAEDTV